MSPKQVIADMTGYATDVTHTPKFFQELGQLDEADIRYLRQCVRYLNGDIARLQKPYYQRNGQVKIIPEDRAEMLRILAMSFVS